MVKFQISVKTISLPFHVMDNSLFQVKKMFFSGE